MTDNDYLKMIAERQEEHGDLLKEIRDSQHQHDLRIDRLEQSAKTMKWVWRTVGGGVLTAFVAWVWSAVTGK